MNAALNDPTRRSAAIIVLLVMCATGAPALRAQGQAAAPPVHWTKVKIDPPVSDVVFPAGDGVQIATQYCLICHSAEMVLHQPPLTQSQWLAEIRKMRAFWGSFLPADKDQALAGYLARINGPATAQKAPPTETSR